MATPFSTIYERAIFRFADYELLKQDMEAREDILQRYLFAAKTDFQRISRVDLTDYDLTLKQFNQDLSDEEIEILGLGLSYYWLSYKTLNSELLKNVLNTKDYYYFSPANHLYEVQTLRASVKEEFRAKMRQYSYFDNTIAELKNR